MRKNNGITLIALVVTIIVLLILAGVSITMIAGENGIAIKAQNSKIQTVHGNVKEIISLAQSEYYTDFQTENIEDDFISYLNSKNNNAINSDGQIDVEKLTGSKQGAGNGSNKKDVYILEKKLNVYYLKYYDANGKEENLLEFESGSVTITDWQEILANATKHPDQTESETIGIDYKGNPVNMDDWEFFWTGNGYSLGINAHGIYPSFKGTIENGLVVGELPQFIKEVESDEFYPVVYLTGTFAYCTELEFAPKIPDTVIYMINTFYGCTALTQAPRIPEYVVNMMGAFCECENLVQAPVIPEGVISLEFTFKDCIALKDVPELPSTIEDLSQTFQGCTSLSKAPVIPNNVLYLEHTFNGCTSLEIAPSIPNGVKLVWGTFQNCSNLKTAPVIPESVTHLDFAFQGCSNLTGTLTVNTTLNAYYNALLGAATAEGTDLKLTGTCENLSTLLATANGNVSILSTEN